MVRQACLFVRFKSVSANPRLRAMQTCVHFIIGTVVWTGERISPASYGSIRMLHQSSSSVPKHKSGLLSASDSDADDCHVSFGVVYRTRVVNHVLSVSPYIAHVPFLK